SSKGEVGEDTENTKTPTTGTISADSTPNSTETWSATAFQVSRADRHCVDVPIGSEATVDMGYYKAQVRDMIWEDIVAQEAKRGDECMYAEDKFPIYKPTPRKEWRMRWDRQGLDGSFTLWINNGEPAKYFHPYRCVVRVYVGHEEPRYWIDENLKGCKVCFECKILV
ncbi:hypothetical protein QFC21_007374, partial [Naganishia friedmannii]